MTHKPDPSHVPHIPKFELKDGAYYGGNCRNASAAVWDAENNVFWYMRSKFGSVFHECIAHPEDDNGFDLFYPLVETVPTEHQRVDLVKARAFLKELTEHREKYAAEQAAKKNDGNGA